MLFGCSERWKKDVGVNHWRREVGFKRGLMWQPGIWRVVENPGGPAAPVERAPAKSHRSAAWHMSPILDLVAPPITHVLTGLRPAAVPPLHKGPTPHTASSCVASVFSFCFKCLWVLRRKPRGGNDREVAEVSPPARSPHPSVSPLASWLGCLSVPKVQPALVPGSNIGQP